MIAFLIVILIVLALISVIWGRDVAQGCAASLVRNILTALAVIVVFFLLVLVGVPSDTVATLILLCSVALLLFLVFGVITNKVEDARYKADKQSRKEQSLAREEAEEQANLQQAEAALQVEIDRRVTSTAQLRPALSLNQAHNAYILFRKVGCDVAACGMLRCYRKNFGTGKIQVCHETVCEPPDSDSGLFLPFPQGERDRLLEGAVFAVTEVLGNNDDDTPANALLAVTGLRIPYSKVAEAGHAYTVHARVARLLNSVAWDSAAPTRRRIAAVLALGLYDAHTSAQEDVAELPFDVRQSAPTGPTSIERLAEFTTDPSPAVRKAVAFALGLRLSSRDGTEDIVAAWRSSADPVIREAGTQLAQRYVIGNAYAVRVAGDALIPLVHDADLEVREMAVEILGRVNTKEARATLRECTQDDRETTKLRTIAAAALRGDGIKEAQPTQPNIAIDLFGSVLSYLNEYDNSVSDSISTQEDETVVQTTANSEPTTSKPDARQLRIKTGTRVQKRTTIRQVFPSNE